jgi:beta-lactamase class A
MRGVSALIALASITPLYAASDSVVRLEQQIALVAKATDGVVGVSATHIESGRSVSLRGSDPFPMASSVKVTYAVQLLSLVDEGKLTLDKMVTLAPQDLHPGSSTLSDLFFHPGVSLSLENYLELMLVISDNSAADVVLKEVGGPAAVTRRMRDLGFPGIRVDRSIARMVSDWQGVKQLPPESQWRKDLWDPLYNAVPQREHMAAWRAQWVDPRDTATPDDMTRLLTLIWKRELLSPESAQRLFNVMQRCRTGKSRLIGMLPQGTVIAHKTGTLGGVADDVGVITLPGDAGHVAISVFTRSSFKPEEASEKAVAEIARTVYDYFVLVRE